MKKELFEDISPYSKVVLAIKEDAPIVSNSFYPYETIQLTRDLLTKNFKVRLNLCPNRRIGDFCKKDFNNKTSLEKEFETIFNTSMVHKAKVDEIEKINRTNQEKIAKRNEISNKIEKAVDNCFEKIKMTGLYTKYSKSKNFHFRSIQQLTNQNAVKQFLYKIEGELTNGFIRPFFFLVHMVNDENSLTTISATGVFLGKYIKADIDDPMKFFDEIYKEKNPTPRLTTYNRIQSSFNQPSMTIEKCVAFSGTFEPDDQFEDNLAIKFGKLIKVALVDMEPEVIKELEFREKLANNQGQGFSVMGTSVSKTKFFFKI